MKWTNEVKEKIRELAMDGKSNKEIAEILGTKTEYIRNARSRFGLTNEKIGIVKEVEISKDRCFADVPTNSKGAGGKKGCAALVIKECKGCAFFKTVEQKAKDDERTKKRLESLRAKAVNIFF